VVNKYLEQEISKTLNSDLILLKANPISMKNKRQALQVAVTMESKMQVPQDLVEVRLREEIEEETSNTNSLLVAQMEKKEE